jgi:hypothetical protein
LPGRGPGSGSADPLLRMIDSSFLRLYTGPPKPPVVGDLAGSERGVHAGEFGATTRGREEPEAVHAAAGSDEAAFPLKFFLIHRGSAASLRNMMGVFPLADTMIRFSVAPWSRGHTPAGANGWTNEVWWYPHPTTSPRRDAAAVHLSDLSQSFRSDHAVLRHRPRDPAGPCRSYVSERTRSPRVGSRQRIAVKQ